MSSGKWDLVKIRVVSASPSEMINALHTAKVDLFDARLQDELTVTLSFSRRDIQKVMKVLERRGESHTVIQRIGFMWYLRGLGKRPVLLAGLLLTLMMTVFLPTRIFFIQISGNKLVSTGIILTELENNGIRFGTVRRSIRNERIKNNLLESIPQLQWVGVNTRGCVAEITVKERTVPQKGEDADQPRSIIASRDAVIRKMTVTAGNPLCKVGEAVRKGQMLVSSYIDCGILVKTEPAQGEIFADTNHDLALVTPVTYGFRGRKIAVEKKYSLKIGKKSINFFKDSGISDASCVKMYEQHNWNLGAGFSLPVAWICCTVVRYDVTENPTALEEDFLWVENAAEQYLLSSMTAGRIFGKSRYSSLDENTYRFYGHYACNEMIGQVCDEEIYSSYGKRD